VPSVVAARPVVHLELHTRDLPQARELYAGLCGWPGERVTAGDATYLALELGTLSGGIVACATARPVWVPYVEVRRVDEATDRARGLGATVLLEPRACANGWRSVVTSDHGGEMAFWQRR
jgi:predicted enzyme related to lactoylglutathione lyase